MYIWYLAWLCFKLEVVVDVFAATIYTIYLLPSPQVIIEPKTPEGFRYCELRVSWLVFSVGLSCYMPHMYIRNKEGEFTGKTFSVRSSIDMIKAN